MEYISSDTNVWLDFVEIEKLNLPFQLPYIYIMNDETIEDELLNPPGISDKLLQLGLQKDVYKRQVQQPLWLRCQADKEM